MTNYSIQELQQPLPGSLKAGQTASVTCNRTSSPSGALYSVLCTVIWKREN